MQKGYLSQRESIAYLGIGKDRFYKWQEEGKIIPFLIGKQTKRFKVSELDELMEEFRYKKEGEA